MKVLNLENFGVMEMTAEDALTLDGGKIKIGWWGIIELAIEHGEEIYDGLTDGWKSVK